MWCSLTNLIYQLTANDETLIYAEDSFGALEPQDEPYLKPTFSNPMGQCVADFKLVAVVTYELLLCVLIVGIYYYYYYYFKKAFLVEVVKWWRAIIRITCC